VRCYYSDHCVVGLITLFVKDGKEVSESGFFKGYDWAVWLAIMLSFVKYADNILKGFATSAAIILSCIISIYFFNFQLSIQFVGGATLVMISVYMYGRFPYVAPAVTEASSNA